MDYAVKKTVVFIALVFAFVAVFGTLDIQSKVADNEAFISNLERNTDVAEIIGLGYEVVDVKQTGSKVYPEVTAELEMYGFPIYATFNDKELTTMDLIVACEQGKVAGSKVCYSQSLYPAESGINNYIKE